jgi:tight adherence protein C
MTTTLATITFFCLVGAAGVAIYMAVGSPQRAVAERFADIAVKMRIAQGALNTDEPSESFSRLLFEWASKRMPAPDKATPQGEKLAQTLVQAGFIRSSAPQMFQVIRLGCALGGGVLGLVSGLFFASAREQMLAFAAVGAGVGAFAPTYYIGWRARKRQLAIARQLSDVLDLLVVCVEAGLGLYEAIKLVGIEADRQKQEIGLELGLVGAEISAGASLGQALRSLAERTAVEDIKPLAATLIQSEQLGAQIGPALRASSDALRTRRRLRAEENAQKASVKILFPLVLFVLPAMIAVIIGPALIQIMSTLGGHG